MKLVDVLKSAFSKPNASVADLRAALADIDIVALEAAVTAAERSRAGLLIDGTEAALDDADAALKHAIRDRDRGIAAKAELGRRLAEAEAAAAASAFEYEKSSAETEAKAVEKLLRDRWPKLQAEMVAILERLVEAEKLVSNMNARLQAADRTDTIASVETRVWATPQYQLSSLHSISYGTVLKKLPGVKGWG